jgi:hypothetical protein
MQDRPSNWQEVDCDLNDLARELGMGSSREAMFNAALDELARERPELGIPTEAEALAWAEATGRTLEAGR